MSKRGIPVFNAPGANANAVKELVLAGMLMAARNLPQALEFVAKLEPDMSDMDRAVEDGKKNFAGFELAGQTLGVIGLGKVGCLVADAAIKLGMKVIGYDPRSRSMPPGACLRRSKRRNRSTRYSRTPTSSRCTFRWSKRLGD